MVDSNIIKNKVSALLKDSRPVAARQLLVAQIKKNKKNADLWYMLGTINTRLERYDEAEDCYLNAVNLAADYFSAYYGLGMLYRRTHKLDKAEQALKKASHISPAEAVAMRGLAEILCAQGKHNEAEKNVRNFLDHEPHNVTALHVLAKILQLQKRFHDALGILDIASKLQPENSEIYFEKGLLLELVGNLPGAEGCYRNAIKYQPEHFGALNNLANLLCSQGQYDEAIGYFQRAISRVPDNDVLYFNLGVAYLDQNRLHEAEHSFLQALKYKADSIGIYNNLGTIYKKTGRLSEAENAFRRALRLNPNAVYPRNFLGIVLKEKGEIFGALKNFIRALEIEPGDNVVHSNFVCCLNYCLNIDNKVLAREHIRWAELHAKAKSIIEQVADDRNRDRQLRIGYLSPDFRDHPIGFFIEGLLKHHNSKEVQTYCYANVSFADSVTDRLKNLANHWLSIEKMSDEAVIDHIRRDKIDILVDLAGHFGGNRLLVFAGKPAQVQVTYLGYPNTTGLTQMDYLVTDEWTDPEGDSDNYYTEKLVRITPPFFCYSPPKEAPEITSVPALATGRVTFGSLNNLAKINKSVVRLWSRILRGIPGSRLLLQSSAFDDEAVRKRLVGQFLQCGIPAERLLLKKRMPFVEHLGVYGELDVALDPFPWNGHTTTCHALWMGVPVITLAGERHSGRLSRSVLFSLGLNEWVAETEEQYLQLAVTWAGRLDELNKLRKSLRERMSDSPLCDGSRLAREMEGSYRKMWRQWCRVHATD